MFGELGRRKGAEIRRQRADSIRFRIGIYHFTLKDTQAWWSDLGR
jgi:hypothetical protein